MWARTRWPFSSSTRNIAFGRGSTTRPSTSIAPSFLAMSSAIRDLVCSVGLSWARKRFRNRERLGHDGTGARDAPKDQCTWPARAAAAWGGPAQIHVNLVGDARYG